MPMQVWQFKDQAFHRQNHYRFNPERGYWEFSDGIGPWAPSGNMEKLGKDDGETYLRSIAYRPLDTP